MSSTCPRFAQNAWKKELCSNCFKSREEHKSLAQPVTATPKKDAIKHDAPPPKGIMKNTTKKTKKFKVSFPNELTKVIGYGGEWTDSEESDNEFQPSTATKEEQSSNDEDQDQELQRITKANTDFNMNNGNLLGDPEENIKKSFAALRLGTPQISADGKKQTLKISVTPFGSQATPSKMSTMKAKFEPKVEEVKKVFKVEDKLQFPVSKNEIEKPPSKLDGKVSPPIERAMEKSLLEEISETLEKKQQQQQQQQQEGTKLQTMKDDKIKFEISSATDTTTTSKACLDLKKSIARHSPITKEHSKPKMSVFQKYSDSESNTSDNENNVSAYYDVVEATENAYENIPDGYEISSKSCIDSKSEKPNDAKSIYSTNQFIANMLLTAKSHAASYSLHEGSYITSKITSDGLIVTKCNSDDALDSTGSSFDGSSDEETSYNMNRSESDSGIGISIGSDYQTASEKDSDEKKPNSNSNSDYEDIQVLDLKSNALKDNKMFAIEKSRELAGEPDGSADPDVSSELPALPKSPPPITPDPRISFLHGMQKNIATKKPDVPTKPAVNIVKTFVKRPPNQIEQQFMSQLQQVIKQPSCAGSPPPETPTKENNDLSKQMKKGRAPNPPPVCGEEKSTSTPSTPEKESLSDPQALPRIDENVSKDDMTVSSLTSVKLEESHSTIYTRNQTQSNIKSNSPVIREKDKRERATINPKFRSLNTFNTNRKMTVAKPSTPEPAPRKNLSMSEECLADDKKKKNKFSIKKFLRMGTSKTTDNLQKKDGIYSEIMTGEDPVTNGRPRLVIIHPIDINPTAVEVVKEIKKSPVSSPVITGKPPAPPQRTGTDSQRMQEINKPARPPPPKSAELRRKQKVGFVISTPGGSVKSRNDNVYANLGEIRSAIAPRKPERTASMREREAQLELARKRQGNENSDTISVCSSNGGSVSNDTQETLPSEQSSLHNHDYISAKPTITEIITKDDKIMSNYEVKKKLIDLIDTKLASKLELYERNIAENSKTKKIYSDDIKTSVLKINTTIDNYLKDKRDQSNSYDLDKTSAPPTPTRTINIDLRNSYEAVYNKQNLRSSFGDNVSISGASCVRSECGPRYGYSSIANIPRVVSASYCGSEMGESDIYSPYSIYGSETGGDVANDITDGVWGVQQTNKSRSKATNRLRMRKGRSVVHKNIEDNYSAVVTANHEALAQVLDQLQQTPIIPVALRPLANSLNLRFEDFNIVEGNLPFVVGKRAFHAAIWGNTPVTLAMSGDCNQISGVGGELNQFTGGVSGVLNPITEFCDLVPSYHLPLMPSTEVRMLQSTISVLPRMQLDTLQSIGSKLKNKSQLLDKHVSNFHGSIPNLTSQKEQVAIRSGCSVQNLSTLNEEITEKPEDFTTIPGIASFDEIMCREVGFIMLQLVNGLKNLQAKALEEMPLSLSNVVLCREAENKEAQARLCLLQGVQDEDEQMATLCKCAHAALTDMLPSTKLSPILSDILIQERSESLSKAKSVLEYALWGPSDVTLNGSTKERELALQRWLDLERATVLHGLVRTRVELTVYDECHLMFLVRSTAKIMNEAAKIVCSLKKLDE